MLRHLKNIHGELKRFQCAICSGNFDIKIKLKLHIESVHGKIVPLDSLEETRQETDMSEPGEFEEPEEENQFNCAMCSDSFKHKVELKDHIKSAHGKTVPLDSL